MMRKGEGATWPKPVPNTAMPLPPPPPGEMVQAEDRKGTEGARATSMDDKVEHFELTVGYGVVLYMWREMVSPS